MPPSNIRGLTILELVISTLILTLSVVMLAVTFSRYITTVQKVRAQNKVNEMEEGVRAKVVEAMDLLFKNTATTYSCSKANIPLAAYWPAEIPTGIRFTPLTQDIASAFPTTAAEAEPHRTAITNCRTTTLDGLTPTGTEGGTPSNSGDMNTVDTFHFCLAFTPTPRMSSQTARTLTTLQPAFGEFTYRRWDMATDRATTCQQYRTDPAVSRVSLLNYAIYWKYKDQGKDIFRHISGTYWKKG